MNPNPTPGQCSRCGAALPVPFPGGLCPKCLLEAGLGTQPQPGVGEPLVPPPPATLKGVPQPGEQFGHYRLVRLLGQGGMGVVFEAEDLDAGRRVALKILSQALDSPEARKRFLREGQIAAAINHPNSVYVFGTEEIAGTPVIAMELVGGGTLRDRVVATGPYPAAAAVDTLLQIMAGLEAAQRAGVLHRDVKPSNCFIDSDGSVKIGDFGLSISTSVRTESNLTGAGSLFGTPAFSSPEQLRGEELTVRSDIYSVGVTLYYLLTGRMPFEAPNLVQLLVTVLERRPPSPARLRASIPEGLGRAVLRCLNKDPGGRFDGYAALRRALLPYASFSPTPATLALRFAAWVVDHLILGALSWLAFFTLYGGFDKLMSPGQDGRRWLVTLFSFLVPVAYYGWFEGRRGATPGKALCRLRVVGLDGTLPGWRRGFLRALIFCGASTLTAVALIWLGQDWIVRHPFAGVTAGLFQLALFCTCRRENGFAGLHDLGSGTRVLAQSPQPFRPGLPPAPETPPAIAELAPMGPYHILAELGPSAGAQVRLGYDARLLRKVWLRRVPAATPPVAMALRHLARPARFRWLNGKRSPEESWDVYEAATGRPLLDLLATSPDWGRVRFWLLDLAEELQAAEKDGSLPAVLSLDRVWITADGRAKLLDFPAPGSPRPGAGEADPPVPPAEFLRQTAGSALTGRPLSVAQARASTLDPPFPLYARGLLQRLGTAADAGRAGAELRQLVGKPAVITRRRRLAMLGLALIPPLFSALMAALGSYWMASERSMEMVALHESLRKVAALEPAGTNAPIPSAADDEKRRQLEIYIAGRFRPIITNGAAWNGPLTQSLVEPAQRTLAAQVAAKYPRVTPAEFAGAKTVAESQLHISPASPDGAPPSRGFPIISQFMGVMLYACPLMYVVIPCLLAAFLFRGGVILQGLGIAVVGGDGRPSRWCALRRNFIAWLPFLLSPMLVHGAHFLVGSPGDLLVTAGVLGLITVVSLALHRSLQDRLARTWLVPGGRMPADELAQAKRRNRWAVIPLAVAAGLAALVILEVQFSHWGARVRQASQPDPGNLFPARECIALLPDGTPAADARVWVGTNQNVMINCFRPGEYTSFWMEKLQADARGRFTLPGVAGDRQVILTHPDGILMTTAAGIRSGASVRLQSFGRVEGRLLSEGQPKPGADVSIGIIQDRVSLGLTYSAVSDGDGRFTFTNLPAGEYRLDRVFWPRRHREGPFTTPPSHQKIIAVRAGETVRVEWGGDGRSVVGQAASENPALTVDWLNDHHSLELATASSAGLIQYLRDSWGLGKSAAAELSVQRAARSYHLEFEPDGSFRAEDVPPGKYELHLRVTKPKTGPNPFLEPDEVLGSLVRTVTIPAGTGPYDLGRQVVSVKAEPGVTLDVDRAIMASQPLGLTNLPFKPR